MFKKLAFYGFFFFILQNVVGQVFDFEVLNQKNGLPSSTIFAITQDSRNLIWIGTDGAGLVRYDGRNFKIINKINGSEGLVIIDIMEDNNHNILVATAYHGRLPLMVLRPSRTGDRRNLDASGPLPATAAADAKTSKTMCISPGHTASPTNRHAPPTPAQAPHAGRRRGSRRWSGSSR